MATIETFEDKIHEDFLFFLEHFKEPFDLLKSKIEKEICQKWLDKLMTEPHKTMEEKRVRNIYLSQMIMCMNDRKLVIPFNASPKPGPLSLDGVFKQITTKPNAQLEEEEKTKKTKENWSQYVRNRELEIIDLNQLSNDGRTYVACKTLPENSGIFAYVAVTMGGDANDGWVNTCGKSIPAPEANSIDLKVETPYEQEDDREEDKAFQLTTEIRSILSKRRSLESRTMTYEFFKRIYGSIEQEMLSEQDPNSTACHDPYVAKLLEKLFEEGKLHDKFNPKLFKRMNMLSTLKRRVKDVLKNIEKRDDYLEEIEASSTSPILKLTYPAAGCSNSTSEMMWQGALREKPSAKMAEALAKTYPVCLVKMLMVLVARERRKIISMQMEKQEKLVRAMKKEIKNEIQRGIAAYKLARKEWVDVMRVVEHYNRLKESLTEKDIGGDANSTESGYLEETIRKEIEDVRKRVDKATSKNEKLQDDISDLNKSLHEMTEKIECEHLQTADAIRDLQMEICNEKSSILDRTRTIEGLQRMYSESQK